MSNYLDQLNAIQRMAVENVEGPMMIVAGAGSGKTRVLTIRIAHLLAQGVDPFNILALTFTNKASKEMRHRIEELVGAEAKNLWMGTFHSVFAKILRIEASKLGYPSNFTIYDADDTKSILRQIIKEQNLDADNYKPGPLASRISLSKNNFITPSAYINNADLMKSDAEAGKPRIGEIYSLYVQRCHKAGAMDFDDILLNTYRLIQQHPDVTNKYQQKFKFVMVDEYQDTNHLQYLIIKKLAAVTQNICVVGDDAQSIYSFRGANIQNILNFEKDYPSLKIFRLEQNYRSTQTIVEAAGDIIKRNTKQLEKNLWTENAGGQKIKVFKALTDNEEGNMVAQFIEDEKYQLKRPNADFAVLYRTNSQSRAIEEGLRRAGLDYRIIGGLSFYQRKEVKDLLSYFKLVINPSDSEAFRRVVNYPLRGIGNTSLDKIAIFAASIDKPLFSAAQIIHDAPKEHRLSGSTAKALYDFTNSIQALGLQAENRTAYDAGLEIAKGSGLLRLLNEDKTPEGINRYENVQQLLTGLQEFSEREPELTLADYLQDISLLTDADTKDDSLDRITLMTIHQAKGLEWPIVFVVGMEENLFPSQMMLADREDLEEERRLFYVALTRARERAFLSYADSRFRFGNIVRNEPSRFIDEISARHLDYPSKLRDIEREGNRPAAAYSVPRIARVSAPSAYQPSPNFIAEAMDGLAVGDQVEHNRFGFGQVISIDGKGDQTKAMILFQEAGSKQILLKYAKMKLARP